MNDRHSEDTNPRFKIVFDPSLLDPNTHIQVVGRSGSGKTSLFIAQWTSELIRRRLPHIHIVDLNREQTLPAEEGA